MPVQNINSPINTILVATVNDSPRSITETNRIHGNATTLHHENAALSQYQPAAHLTSPHTKHQETPSSSYNSTLQYHSIATTIKSKHTPSHPTHLSITTQRTTKNPTDSQTTEPKQKAKPDTRSLDTLARIEHLALVFRSRLFGSVCFTCNLSYPFLSSRRSSAQQRGPGRDPQASSSSSPFSAQSL